MRACFFSITTLIFLNFAWAAPHPSIGAPQAAAIYLKPYSAVPTGHHNVEYLKSTLVSQEKIRWVLVRDTTTGLSGWTPKQNLLTPLHFSTKARLLAGSPVFREKRDRRPDPSLSPKSETSVELLDIQSEWVMVSLPQNNGSQIAWVPIAQLYSVDRDAGYFFARSSQPLRKEAGNKSTQIAQIAPGQRLRPIGALGDWVHVGLTTSKGYMSGYLPADQIISRVDIAMKVKTPSGFEKPRHSMIAEKIYAIYVNPLWLGTAVNSVPLFSDPVASAPVLGYAKPWQSLLQQDSIEQDWACSKIADGSLVWWQIPDNRGELLQLTKLELASIKQIKENPVFKHIKTGSAKGLYRTTDGVYWAPIRGFQGYNPAFAYATDGTLFVEDQVSFDNGEHFTPFVYWESLFRTLRENNRGVKSSVKITDIESINKSSQQLILELDIGSARRVKMYTADRGQTWTLLRL